MPSVFLDIKGGMPTVSQSHGTSGSISYETIPPVSLETSGGRAVDRGHGDATTRWPPPATRQ